MCLDFVLRCVAAGHDVRWYRWSKKPIRDGEGMKLNIVEDWEPSMPWARDGLIVVTGNFVHMHTLDRYREMGYRVFGPTAASARLEIERGAGMEAMKAVGIEVPPYQMFDGLEAARDFARKSDRAWVFKPTGDEGDKSLTYVSKDPADLVGWIERKIASGKVLKGKAMLQEKVELLCELGVSGWCGPEGFLPDKYQICIEHKKLMDGEIGPATGEQGTVCQYVIDDKLADECLKPMEPVLRALGHTGDFAVGAAIGKDGKPYVFEFTARLGYPAFYIQMASHSGDPAQWMLDLLDGKDTLKVSRDVAIGVVCAQPRYPYNNSPPEMVEGHPISGLESVWSDIHPVSVMLGKGPMMHGGKVVDGPTFQTTGEYVLVATGLGKSVEKARARVYGTIDEIGFADMLYRTDIGCKVVEALSQLHRHGYCLDLT